MIYTFIDFLAACYKAGNFPQMETIARTMLDVVPDNLVSLLFIGLALYQTGRLDDAYLIFKSAVASQDPLAERAEPKVCETANAALFRAATRPQSGLSDAWRDIASALYKLELLKPAVQKDQPLKDQPLGDQLSSSTHG
jgi:tetratricopeptide (TPR) repeat protein